MAGRKRKALSNNPTPSKGVRIKDEPSQENVPPAQTKLEPGQRSIKSEPNAPGPPAAHPVAASSIRITRPRRAAAVKAEAKVKAESSSSSLSVNDAPPPETARKRARAPAKAKAKADIQEKGGGGGGLGQRRRGGS